MSRVDPLLRSVLVLASVLLLACNAVARGGDEQIRVGGAPDPSTLPALKASGVTLIVDLRQPSEGLDAERAAARAAGIRYVDLPVGRDAADPAVIAAFASLVEETDGDVLLHCHSGNRAGEVYARWLLEQGASLDAALEAGRRAGLARGREKFVRAAATGADSAGAEAAAQR